MAHTARLLFPVSITRSLNDGKYDGVVIVGTGIDEFNLNGVQLKYKEPLTAYKKIDKSDNEVFVIALPDTYRIKRLVYSPTGPLNRDYDDVRRFAEAAYAGIKRALSAGSRNPVVVLPNVSGGFVQYNLSVILGALHALYVPLEIREDVPNRQLKVDSLGITNYAGPLDQNQLYRYALAIEHGRIVCRDIAGSDPERMAPPNVAAYVQHIFQNSPVKVEIISDRAEIEKEYPLLAAVDRAARSIERHKARVIYLTYEPEGRIDTTVVLVGKGVTYDTGGADIKAGGVMASMHRDKCGSAAVAGFFQVLAHLQPKGIRVYGAMAMVRNSVGADGYVADEIVTSRAGVRVRVGNTDAEGRMVMSDPLAKLKDKVLGESNAYMFTIATLTGHAILTVGHGYSIILDNGPARQKQVSASIKTAGDEIGDLFEVSTIRREDYLFHDGKSEYEDTLQAGNNPSARTPRGHQGPAAFLLKASGLDKHGLDSSKQICYSHIDIAASSGPYPGVPSGAPIAALSHRFLFERL